MDKRIDPDLFARLMMLSSGQRTDLLEYLGHTPMAPEDVLALPQGETANVNDAITESGQD